MFKKFRCEVSLGHPSTFYWKPSSKIELQNSIIWERNTSKWAWTEIFFFPEKIQSWYRKKLSRVNNYFINQDKRVSIILLSRRFLSWNSLWRKKCTIFSFEIFKKKFFKKNVKISVIPNISALKILFHRRALSFS